VLRAIPGSRHFLSGDPAVIKALPKLAILHDDPPTTPSCGGSSNKVFSRSAHQRTRGLAGLHIRHELQPGLFFTRRSKRSVAMTAHQSAIALM